MCYADFLKNIHRYVGTVVEFTIREKSSGKIFKSERFVWDCNEFGMPGKDAAIDVLDVKVIRGGTADALDR